MTKKKAYDEEEVEKKIELSTWKAQIQI